MRLGPQVGPQTEFLKCQADVAIYGGAAGGGKTFGLLLESLRNVRNPGYMGVIFRRTLEEVKMQGGLWDESMKLFPFAGGVPKESELEWRFKSGAVIKFQYLNSESSKYRYQGAQFAFMGFDELTHFSEGQFFYMLSRNRSTCGVRPYVRATTNPDSQSWVRKFLDPWLRGQFGDGEVAWLERDGGVRKWHSSQRESCLSFSFIRAKVSENPLLLKQNPEYLTNLKALSYVDRMRLLEGNWDVVEEGNFFRREWFKVFDAAPRGLTCLRFWDLAATEATGTKDPDYTVGVLLGLTNDGTWWVLDVVRERLTPGAVEQLVLQTAKLDRERFGCQSIRMEQEPGSSGIAVIQRYAQQLLAGFDFRGIRNTGSKADRARLLSAQAEVGNVRLVSGGWNSALLDELCLFPTKGVHDDQVDAASGAFACLTAQSTGFFAIGGGEPRGGLGYEPR